MSSLAELERQATALCMGGEPSASQLTALGDARIWALYREMVQNRLRGELRVALRRSCDALGDLGLACVFEAWLRDAPPRSRPFHGIVEDFARFAVGFVRADLACPAWTADLIAYEAAFWAVGDMADGMLDTVQELSFEAPPCFTPARRMISLAHAVHEAPSSDGSYRQTDVVLCVYRRPEDKAARSFVLNPTLHALMVVLERDELTLTQAVQRVAKERKLRVDQAFIDGLCTVLANFSERGLLLGSKG